MSFYEKLLKETESQRQALYGVSQLEDGLRGDIDVDSYVAYLTQAYHHVKHTVPYLMTMGARLPEGKIWLQQPIIEYLKEEVGHEEWILNDIKAAGFDREEAKNSTPYLATQAMVSYNYDYLTRKNPVGFFGMVFMLESTSVAIANKGAEALKNGTGLPDEAFSYLTSHGALDIKHMQFFQTLMEKIDDPADQNDIIEVAQNTFLLFAAIFRSIPHKDKEDHKEEHKNAA